MSSSIGPGALSGFRLSNALTGSLSCVHGSGAAVTMGREASPSVASPSVASVVAVGTEADASWVGLVGASAAAVGASVKVVGASVAVVGACTTAEGASVVAGAVACVEDVTGDSASQASSTTASYAALAASSAVGLTALAGRPLTSGPPEGVSHVHFLSTPKGSARRAFSRSGIKTRRASPGARVAISAAAGGARPSGSESGRK